MMQDVAIQDVAKEVNVLRDAMGCRKMPRDAMCETPGAKQFLSILIYYDFF